MHHADRGRFAAHRAGAPGRAGFVRFQPHPAGTMTVQMVLAFFREKLHGAAVTLAGFQGVAYGKVVQVSGKRAGFPAQFFRRVGVRIGYQPEAVQRRHPPVHRRVRGQAGFDGKDVRRQVPVAQVDRVKARFRAQRRVPRRPDVGWNQIGVGAGLQRDLQQVAGIQAQDRPPVGSQVADLPEAAADPFGGLEVRRVYQVVDPAGCSILLVDGRNFGRQHEAHGAAAGPRQPAGNGPLQIRTQAVQAGFGGNQVVLELGKPGRMREVAGADDGEAFLAGPQSQVFQVTVAAGSAGVSGVHVQVGVETHRGTP